ncbi:putative bifunctional diguanylate cyclase/phosphodiesterase [Azorhizophilus paspali]
MNFVLSANVVPPAIEPESIRKRYGVQMEAAVNRRLYRAAPLPIILMLSGGLSCVLLRWEQHSPSSLAWLALWLGLLVGLSLWRILAFFRTPAERQADPGWRFTFLVGAAVSGATLTQTGIFLLPLATPLQQALIHGLLAAATICASMAYAASLRAFLAFALPALLPSSLYLLSFDSGELQGWGSLGLILLAALVLSAWQINRATRHNLLQHYQNCSLLEFEKQSRSAAAQLNDELAREVQLRKQVEEELRSAQKALEERVDERTRALTASERARREEKALRRYLSSHDPMTGLANRSLLLRRLKLLASRPRVPGHELVLMHFNLDRFKRLNESLGHQLADEIVRELARRLGGSLRRADIVARIAVDEFAVLLNTDKSLDEVEQLGRHLLTLLRHGVSVDEHEVVVSASLGIGLLSAAGGDPTTLLCQAAMAMRHAKQLGCNTVQFYRDGLQSSSRERLLLEAQLDKALGRGELEVFYQPKLNFAANRLQGAEALVRWRHPQRGLVSPAQFIPLAEETGQIGAIGDFVLSEACSQASAWLQAGIAGLRVAVNVSMGQLRQGNFVERVGAVLARTGLPAHLLELELTESQLSDDVEHLTRVFGALRALGVRLAIDDFGTGYSSLGYLKHLPVNVVKIDQIFIRSLDGSGRGGDAAIIRAIIVMAHNLGLEVVAEGVEEPAQLEFLREHGCDEIQGYLIGRPVEAAILTSRLHEQTAQPSCAVD